MEIKNLNIKLTALTMAGILAPINLCGCSNSTKEKQENIEQIIETEETTEEKVITKKFDVGKHYMTIKVDNPTNARKQYRYVPGYKPFGISISSGLNSHAVDGEIIYVNDSPVEVTASRDRNGIYQYNTFGNPIEYEKKEHKKIVGKKEFFPGEHIISTPVTNEMFENNEFEVHNGYEPIGIAEARGGYKTSVFAGACILYVNKETVICTRDENNEYTSFGTIKNEEKIMEKNK